LHQVTADKQTLGQAYRQLVLGREEERKRIARELHDQVIQNLLGLKFHLADHVVGSSPLQDEINTTIETIRHLCADLRPPALDHLGLAAALRSYVQDVQARTNLVVELHLDEATLAEDTALALFRVAQEALTNAWRHAHARGVRVTLQTSRDAVELSVEDDGCGFVVPERLGALVEQGHFGLMSMRERVELVGGTLRIESQPGGGTRVHARVPLADR
jgi:signal transduction histidine kinase